MMHYPKPRTILCICIVLAASLSQGGEARAGLWGYHGPTDPGLEGSPLEDTPSDLPPGWVMSRMDPVGRIETAKRDPDVAYDPTIGQIRETYTEGGVETGTPLITDLDEYSNVLTTRTYRRLWRDSSRDTRSITRGAAKKPQGLFHYDLPIQIPKFARGILGDGAPNIDVSGSETITLSGVSDWTVQPKGAIQQEHARPSAFPSLEMKQDLQVNLTGSIGDKIKVDVDQSSNVQTSLDNKVKLRYEGDEDDMIKSIDLGNTNLSLPGASIRQDGLFGVKTVAKLGNVDVVTIASKQEGKSETARFTPSGENREVKIGDLSYIKWQYFFIADHPMNWLPGTLRVYRDNRNASDNTGRTIAASARVHPELPADSTNPQFDGSFDILSQGVDYDLILPYATQSGSQQIPVIKFRYPLTQTDFVAVYYEEEAGPVGSVATGQPVVLKAIKPDYSPITTLPGGAFDPNDPWFPALAYELRNFYDLTARNIAPETLTLKVRRIDQSVSVDPDAIGDKPLIQILGLDKQGATVNDLPDGRIDPNYLDAENGIVFFPDLHPYDPGCPSSSQFPLCSILDDTNRNILGADSLKNPNVYYTKNPDILSQTRYYIDAQFKSSQQGYFLGRINILENSEQVKVDNVLQKKDSDYTIDYETGQLTFSRPPGPDAVISVDYSFAPGVSQVQRTLMGFSTSYSPSADLSVTSSMLYESRGAQELNPKLGEEPARSMVGSLASILTFRPTWMTQLSNMIPGVHTSAPSTMNLQGNVAVSMPNPNTKGEAYIDDMEGNRESNTLALGRTGWMWSSIPLDTVSLLPVSLLVGDHARIQWYNPTSSHGGAHERDLKPILTKEEGSDNEHTVLEMNMLAQGDSTNVFTSKTWTGITQPLSRTGQDLSRTRFVEIWINDRVQNHTLTHANLHLDFGKVSEDAFWEKDALPNGLLDTEDKNRDTKLDVGEDTGLDGLMDPEEPGYDPTTNPDPDGDDYHYDSNHPTDYSGINGTEGSSAGIPNSRPDTEDLDLNGNLDVQNSYFEATLALSDTNFVAVDVARDYAGSSVVLAEPDNGWRLFRIPLEAFKPIGGPSWDDVKHARIWVDGMTGPTNLQIGGIELVGSRWLPSPLTDAQKQRNVVFDVKVRNNKDDAGGPAFYTAPFDVPNAVGGNATRREQSLALSYDRLQTGDSVFSFKTFADNGSGIGYTQYRDVRFYVHGDPGVELQKLRVAARFGTDTVNYYEYSAPVRTGWQDVTIPMEILSRLKEANTDRVKIDSLSAASTGARYTVVGNPSFTRVNRITFGLTVYDTVASSVGPGEVWIDELRLDGVRKDVGKTGNFSVQANFADVLAVNGSYAKQDQDFFQVGSGVNQGTGLNHTAVGFSSTLQLDRMLPVSGLQLPVRVTLAHSTDVPKYRTGSDVVLDKARSDIETQRSDRQSIDFSYSRTGPRKGLTRWTSDAIRGTMAYTRIANVDPQSTDSSWAFSASGNYDLPIGGGRGLPLSKRARFKYLPDIVSFGMDWSASRSTSYSRFIQGSQDSTALRSNVLGRLLTLRTGATYLPLNGVTTKYNLSSRRDMLQRQSGFTGGNVGTEVDHLQSMELNWVPRHLFFLNPNIGLSGSYHEDASPGVRLSASDPLGLKNISNHGSARATTAIPLARLAQRFKSSPRDSSNGSPLLAPFRLLFSRLQDIQTTFSLERSSFVSRVTGKPGFGFITGFTQKIDPTLYRTPSSSLLQNRQYISTASTTIQPLTHVAVDVRADHRISFNDQGLGSRRIYTLSWPDLTGRWLQLERDLGLGEILSSLAVSSHYSLKTEDQGPEGGAAETHVKTTNWGPLLHWEASFRNGIRADVNTAISKSEAVDTRLLGVVQTQSNTTHDIRLTKTYPAAKGIRFPWSKRRVKLPNDVNLNLTVGIARDKQSFLIPGSEPQIQTSTQRLNVGSGTTYNFTPSITGGFDLAFRQTKDYKQDLTQRGITISVNGQFRF
jgi:hypothetical protein